MKRFLNNLWRRPPVASVPARHRPFQSAPLRLEPLERRDLLSLSPIATKQLHSTAADIPLRPPPPPEPAPAEAPAVVASAEPAPAPIA